MNNAILISLAAVVVTIVIIAWAALRFLRADDADPFDEIPDEPRRPSRAPEDTRVREAAPAMASARRSPGRPAPAPDSRNGNRGPDPRTDRARPDFDRGRNTAERPVAAPSPSPARRGPGSGPARPVPVPVAAKAAKPAARPAGKKSSDGPDWDKMSDVDYWAELAADSPFSAESDTVVAPAPARPGRRAKETPGARPADRTDPGPLPSRQRTQRPAAAAASRGADFGQSPADSRPAHAPGRYANGSAEPVTESIAALARLANQSPDPLAAGPGRSSGPNTIPPRSAPQRTSAQHAAPQHSGPQHSGPQHSGPQHSGPQHNGHRRDVPARSPRPNDALTRPQPVLPAPLDDDPLTSPSFPAINASDSRSYRSSRSDTQPGARGSAASYGQPAPQFSYPDTEPTGNGPLSPANGYPVQSGMPAGNPYGSFVSHPAASQQQPPVSAENGYGGGPYTSQQVPGGEGWYPSAIGNGHSQPSRGQHAMPAAGGYLPAGQNGYDQQAYRTGQHEAAGYPPAYPAAQYDQGGYPAHDPRYSREAYQGYPGHGTGGY